MMNRRTLLQLCAGAGLGQTLLPGALAALSLQTAPTQTANGAASAPAIDSFPAITPEMLDAAAVIAGITLTAEQKSMMLAGVTSTRAGLQAIRDLHMPNSVAPAMLFDPLPHASKVSTSLPRAAVVPKSAASSDTGPERHMHSMLASEDPASEDRFAFAGLTQLGEWLRTRSITSVDLTKLYIRRLKRYDPRLHFLITLTEERALKQAAQADTEMDAGKYRGPLHGIPWGAKDLLNVKGYPTTWGAPGMEHQQFEDDATVVQRLDAAGAVLIAKLTLGALAQGDVWFGGKTRNPWNPKQGSSGSSAGPASAVSAGCCAFAIGSETLGSISSPSTRCGVTGLRPTFGFVPRTGAMALSWSMDKLGPICRSAEDAALVMMAIYGPDGKDGTVHSAPFDPTVLIDLKTMRIGYLEAAFAEPTLRGPDVEAEKSMTEEKRREAAAQRQNNFERARYDNRYDRATLDVLRSMGATLIPVKLPDFPYGSVQPVLEVEAAAAFDELTRSGRDSLLTLQGPGDWPNTFRMARMYSGVDYVQAMRARTMMMEKMAELFRTVDVIVTPSGGTQLTATNLSGHPAVIVPNGLREKDAPKPLDTSDGSVRNQGGPGTPVSITFLGQLYDDARLLTVASIYQRRTGYHKNQPPL